MKLLDKKLLNKFLKHAEAELDGEWVLIGGSLLPLLNIDYRITTDIDFIGIGERNQSEILKLMNIAEKLELPIETINQAGSYFLNKIASYHERLVVLRKTNNVTIYRPDVTLFLLLKIPRLSDSDLTDCLEFINYAKKINEDIDLKVTLKAIDTAMIKSKKESNENRKRHHIMRLKQLKQVLEFHQKI